MGKPGLAIALALVAGLAAGPLAADWLVLADGTRLETRGAWSQRGKLVVFTATDGTLSSLRLSEVDLEASRRATQAAARPPAPPPASPPPPPRPAIVLTDADVRRASPDAPAEEDVDRPGADTAGERLVVADWQEAPLPDGDGVRITGTLRNVSGDAATRVRLTVLVYDGAGELLATGDAMLSTQSLMPGRQARFQVDLVGVYAISAVSFRPSTLALDAGGPEAAEAPAELDETEAPVETEEGPS